MDKHDHDYAEVARTESYSYQERRCGTRRIVEIADNPDEPPEFRWQFHQTDQITPDGSPTAIPHIPLSSFDKSKVRRLLAQIDEEKKTQL